MADKKKTLSIRANDLEYVSYGLLSGWCQSEVNHPSVRTVKIISLHRSLMEHSHGDIMSSLN